MGLMGPISPLLICNFTDYNAGGVKLAGAGVSREYAEMIVGAQTISF